MILEFKTKNTFSEQEITSFLLEILTIKEVQEVIVITKEDSSKYILLIVDDNISTEVLFRVGIFVGNLESLYVILNHKTH